MHLPQIALAVLAASSAASAQESCGLRAAQLLSKGHTSELAALFKQPDADTSVQLRKIASKTGSLSQFTAAIGPRFQQHVRYSALSASLPGNFSFTSHRVSATSSLLGSVQVHVAIEPGTACTLLALYLEVDPKVKVASAV